MCGIVGLYSQEPVNQRLYDSLLLLQHRGQDAAGIATLDGLTFHMHKAMGLVRDVFRTRNMRDLLGTSGVGQVRYPTQGNADSNEESQPFYVNAPYGIMFVHNGNLTNAEALKQELYDADRRHINTTSDSEVLLNVFENLIAQGATVIVIEHDLDIIRNADYIIDMGPGGGESGGKIVAAGSPTAIQKSSESITGHYL